MRWGNIPDQHVAMQVYEADSLANAVILGDYGQVHFKRDLSVVFEVHRRVKVFNEGGYDLATVEFGYIHRGRSQRVTRLDGQTFVSDGNGSVRRIRLANSDIHREQDGDVTRVRFTLPALEPGAIFEYRFTLESQNPHHFPDWTFQDVEPTLISEFRADVPTYLTINRFPISNPRFFIEEIDERPFSATRHQEHRYASSNPRQREQVNNTYRWVMRDVPALRDEDFIASVRNHLYAMRFQIAGYYDRNMVHRALSDTWHDVGNNLLESDVFGKRMQPSRSLRRQVDELVGDLTDQAEIASLLYDHVRHRMVWDEKYRFFAERPLDRVHEARSGTSGEINLLLLAMLRAAGVEANPVLVSTRRNGYPQAFFASASQFNHVVVLAEIGGENIKLDAIDAMRPMNMLPPEALNVHGFFLANDRFRWEPLQPAPGTMAAFDLTGEIDASGRVTGLMDGRVAGYAALDLRRRLAKSTDDSERGAIVTSDRQFRYTDVSVEGVEGDGPITFKTLVNAEDHGQPMAHLLTFNPILIGRLSANPFRQPERTYPVDFTHPRLNSYIARFSIPEGYEVDELPARVEMSLPRNDAAFQRVVTESDGVILVQRQYVMNRTSFSPEAYGALREFFDEISKADEQVVVLVRRDTPVAQEVEATDSEEEEL